MRRAIAVLLVLMLTIIGALSAVDAVEGLAPGDALLPELTPHAKVVVNGPSDFTTQGFTGSGLFSDPFVLENVLIDAGGSNSGIFIGNTTSSYFELRNVKVVNANGAGTGPYDQGAGITFYRAEKGKVINSNISSNSVGVAILAGGDISIAQCSFYDNLVGISIKNSLGAPNADPRSISIYRNYFGGHVLGGSAIYASSASYLTIDGNRITATVPSEGILLENCASNIVVEDNDLQGYPGTAIALTGCSGVSIRNNDAANTADDGIRVSGDPTATGPMSGISISGNDLSGTGGAGIRIDAGTQPMIGAVIADNDARYNLYGIYLRLNAESYSNAVERNTADGCSLAGIYLVDFQQGIVSRNSCRYVQDGATGGYGIVLESSIPLPSSGTVNNEITHNDLSHNQYPLWIGAGNDGNVIESNDCSFGAVNINIQSSGNTVASNRIDNFDAPGYNDFGALMGIWINGPGVSNNLVIYNTISLPDGVALGSGTSTGTGIVVQGEAGTPASNNIIEYNQIMFCSVAGISITDASGTEVLGNTIMGSGNGIEVLRGDGNALIGNTICPYSDPMVDGIVLGSSSGNLLDHNSISGLAGIGVVVQAGSNGNIVTSNWISGNQGYGIWISSSTGNSIYLNTFENNNPSAAVPPLAQAYSTEDAGANTWSSGGAPDQGNYWSDLTGPDVGTDGYVDSTYAIDGPSATPESDPHPLTFSIGPVLGLTASTGYRTVQLNWAHSEYSTYAPVTEYNIYRDGVLLASVTSEASQYIDVTAQPGVSYTYWVISSVYGQENAVSPSIVVDVPALVGTNDMDFTINPLAGGEVQNTGDITVSWSQTNDGTSVYYLSLDNFITSFSTTLTTYSFVGLADSPYGQPYTLYIKAVNSLGAFEASSIQFSVDTVGPVVVSNLAYQTIFGDGSVPFFYYIWEDAGSGVVNDTVYLDGVLLWDNNYPAAAYVEYGFPTAINLGDPVQLTGGAHQITIFTQDAAGHLREVTYTFLVDDVAPILTLHSNIGANGYARLPETTFTWSGSFDPVFPSQVLTYQVRMDEGLWKDVGSATSFTTPTLADGPHRFWLKGVDMAGHESIVFHDFFLDSVGPAITSLQPATGANLTDGIVDLSWTATDGDGLGIVYHYYMLDGQAAQAIPSSSGSQTMTLVNVPTGIHQIRVWTVDAAGNVGPVSSIRFVMDGSPPVTTPIVSGTTGTNGWYTSVVTVELSAVDVGSGVAQTQFRYGTTGPWTTYTTPLAINAEGETIIQFNSTDNFGSAEVTKTLVIRIDTAAPITSAQVTGQAGSGGWYTSSVLVNLTAADLTSGLAVIQYDLDGSGWMTYLGNVTVSSNGGHTFLYRAVDIAGNTEVFGTLSFDIDLSGPTTVASFTGAPGLNGWNTSAAIVTLYAVDPTSGVASIMYRVNGGPWTPYTAPFELVNEGVNLIEFNATDLAGNAEVTKSLTISIDTVAPVTTINQQGRAGQENWFSSPLVIHLSGSDASSGVALIQYDLDGAGWSSFLMDLTVLTPGNHTLAFRSVDRAGNVEAVSWANFSIDMTAPATSAQLSGGAGNNGWNTTDVTVTLSAVDDSSGVASILYRINNGAWTTYTEPLIVSNEWITVVEYYATDRAGNVEPSKVVTVKMDKSAPVTRTEIAGIAGTPGWYLSNVAVTLLPADPFSGTASTWYRLDGVGDFVSYIGPITLEGEGAHPIEYYSIDVAGNVEPVRSEIVSIDTIAPDLSIDGPSEGSIHRDALVLVDWTGADSGSGLAGYAVKVDDGTWSALGVMIKSYFVDLTDGHHTIAVMASDAAGNSAVRTLNVTVDTVAPTVVSRSPTGEDNPRNVTIVVEFSEPMDVSTVAMTINGVSGSISWNGNVAVFTPDSLLTYNSTFTVMVSGDDLAGNGLVDDWTFTVVAGKGTLTGVVVDKNGKAVAGALVTLGPGLNTTTDSEGRYSINATQGSYTLIISAPDMLDLHKVVVIAPDMTVDTGSSTMEWAGLTWEDVFPWIIVLAVAAAIVVAVVFVRRRRA